MLLNHQFQFFNKKGTNMNPEDTPYLFVDAIDPEGTGKNAKLRAYTDFSGKIIRVEILEPGIDYSNSTFLRFVDVTINNNSWDSPASLLTKSTLGELISFTVPNVLDNNDFPFPANFDFSSHYLMPVSAGLIESENIFILEKVLDANGEVTYTYPRVDEYGPFNYSSYEGNGVTATIEIPSYTFTAAVKSNQRNTLYNISVPNARKIKLGMLVEGQGVPEGTAIASVNASMGQIVLTKSIDIAGNSLTFTFYAPHYLREGIKISIHSGPLSGIHTLTSVSKFKLSFDNDLIASPTAVTSTYNVIPLFEARLGDGSDEEWFLYDVNYGEVYPTIEKFRFFTFELTNASLASPQDVFTIGNGEFIRQVNGDLQKRPLQINIGIQSYTEGVFTASLEISDITFTYSDGIIYKSVVETEIEGEDERLGLMLENFGRDVNREQELIFRDSDVNEDNVNFLLLNQKRKEMLLQGDQIWPYVGSYKGLVNIINWFGYYDLRIKEYWLNVNVNDTNYKKYKQVPIPFQLKGKGVDRQSIDILPSKHYKKTNFFGLFYDINRDSGNFDEFGLPVTEDAFQFTNEEILIKLFALKAYLKEKFLPLNARIIDITGEGVYYERYAVNNWNNVNGRFVVDAGRALNFAYDKRSQIVDLRPFDINGGLLTPELTDVLVDARNLYDIKDVIVISGGGSFYGEIPLISFPGSAKQQARGICRVRAMATGTIPVLSAIKTTTASGLVGFVVPGTVFSNLSQSSTTGLGVSAIFTVTITPLNTYSVTIINGGDEYGIGDTITIDGSLLGGASGTNDLTITVSEIVTTGQNYQPGDIITLQGGTYELPIRIEVQSVDTNGGVTSFGIPGGPPYVGSNYTSLPEKFYQSFVTRPDNTANQYFTPPNVFGFSLHKDDVPFELQEVTLWDFGLSYSSFPTAEFVFNSQLAVVPTVELLVIRNREETYPAVSYFDDDKEVKKFSDAPDIKVGAVVNVSTDFDVTWDQLIYPWNTFTGSNDAILKAWTDVIPSLTTLGGVKAIEIVDPGKDYVTPPVLKIEGGGGYGASATAEILNGKIKILEYEVLSVASTITPGASNDVLTLSPSLPTTGPFAISTNRIIKGSGIPDGTIITSVITSLNEIYLETYKGDPVATNISVGDKVYIHQGVNVTAQGFLHTENPTVSANGGHTKISYTWDKLGRGDFYQMEWKASLSKPVDPTKVFEYRSGVDTIDKLQSHTMYFPYTGLYTIEMLVYDTNNNISNEIKEDSVEVYMPEADFVYISRNVDECKDTWDEFKQIERPDEARLLDNNNLVPFAPPPGIPEQINYSWDNVTGRWINITFNRTTWNDCDVNWSTLEVSDLSDINNPKYPDCEGVKVLKVSSEDVLEGTILRYSDPNTVFPTAIPTILVAGQALYPKIDPAYDPTDWIFIRRDNTIYQLEVLATDYSVPGQTKIELVTTPPEAFRQKSSGGVKDVNTVLGTSIGGPASFDNLTADFVINPGGVPAQGTGAKFNVEIDDLSVYYVEVVEGGESYQVGDTITILGSKLGGTDGINDVSFVVETINTAWEVLREIGGTVVVEGNRIYDEETNPTGFRINEYVELTKKDATPIYERQIISGIDPESVNILNGVNLNLLDKPGAYGRIYKIRDNIYENGNLNWTTDVSSIGTFSTFGTNSVNAPGDKFFNVPINGGSGIGAIADIEIGSSGNYIVNFTNAGIGYAIGDNLFVSGTFFGGTSPADDLDITVISLSLSSSWVYRVNDPLLPEVNDHTGQIILNPKQISCRPLDEIIPGFTKIKLFVFDDATSIYTQEFRVKHIHYNTSNVGPIYDIWNADVYVLDVIGLDGGTMNELNSKINSWYQDLSSPIIYLEYEYDVFLTRERYYENTGFDKKLYMDYNFFSPGEDFLTSTNVGPAFNSLHLNWFYDHGVVGNDYSLKIVNTGLWKGGIGTILTLDDVNQELYRCDTFFTACQQVFDEDYAEGHVGTRVQTWQNYEEMIWEEFCGNSWNTLDFTESLWCGYIIDTVETNGGIKFNEYDTFNFQGIVGGMSDAEKFSQALYELNKSDNPGISKFNYSIYAFLNNGRIYVDNDYSDDYIATYFYVNNLLIGRTKLDTYNFPDRILYDNIVSTQVFPGDVPYGFFVEPASRIIQLSPHPTLSDYFLARLNKPIPKKARFIADSTAGKFKLFNVIGLDEGDIRIGEIVSGNFLPASPATPAKVIEIIARDGKVREIVLDIAASGTVKYGDYAVEWDNTNTSTITIPLLVSAMKQEDMQIFATAKNPSVDNLGYLVGLNGVTFLPPQYPLTNINTTTAHTFPMSNFYSWFGFGKNKVGAFEYGKQDFVQNYRYAQVYLSEGTSPFGEPGWYPANDLPPAYSYSNDPVFSNYLEAKYQSERLLYERSIGGSYTWEESRIGKYTTKLPAGSAVMFSADASDIAGKTKYLWTMKDADGGILVQTEDNRLLWTFDYVGDFDVELSISDSNGNTKTIEKKCFLNIYEARE